MRFKAVRAPLGLKRTISTRLEAGRYNYGLETHIHIIEGVAHVSLWLFMFHINVKDQPIKRIDK